MNRIVSIYFLLLLTACSVDIPLEDKISGDDAIDTPEAAREALSAAYRSYDENLIYYSFLADDFSPTYVIGRDQSKKQLYYWNALEIANLSDGIWRSHYHSIAQINNVLNSEQYMILKDDRDQKKWDKIKGEASALKAMLYLELFNLYADNKNDRGIVLKNKLELEFSERATINKCLLEIDNLLAKAKTLLKGKDNNVHYLSYEACLILQGRLFLLQKKYQQAIDVTESLLASNGFNGSLNLSNYQALWTNNKSNEKIFSYSNETFPLTYFREDDKLGDYMVISPKIQFKDNDIRKASSIISFKMKKNGSGDKVIRPLLGKYRLSIKDSDPKDINNIRIAEAYFIAAESYSMLKKREKAIQVLNDLLKSRNAEELDPNTLLSVVKRKIKEEKQKEFVGEGLRYFDLKRWKVSIDRYQIDSDLISRTINADDFRWLFPIPKSEIRLNKKIQQNPDWENIVVNIN